MLGRFLSADTIVPDGKNPQQFNRYAYGLNNPVKYTDPTGHIVVCAIPFVAPVCVFIIEEGAELAAAVVSAIILASDVQQQAENNARAQQLNEANAQLADEGVSVLMAVARNVGDELTQTVKDNSKGAKQTQDKVKGRPTKQGALKRPYLRPSTRSRIEANALKTEDGKFSDPNTGRPIEGDYHYGHIYGRENWRLIQEAEDMGMTQQEFNDWVNSHPEWFQIEDPHSNMSHEFERPAP